MCVRGDIPKEKFPAIGVTPAVIGCIQATEITKYIVGIVELHGTVSMMSIDQEGAFLR